MIFRVVGWGGLALTLAAGVEDLAAAGVLVGKVGILNTLIFLVSDLTALL